MIRKIKDFIWKILIKMRIGGPIQLMLNGALIEDGWFISYNQKESIDKNGNPIPWCTYPFIKFIEPRLKKTFNVFEFGSGNSTLWYAERVKKIKSVENDKEWMDYLTNKMPSNAELVYKKLSADGDYSREVMNDEDKYDIIIIDGRDRSNCVRNSIHKLTGDGIIVFDNSNRPNYSEAIDYLTTNEFKRIDFWGMSPVVSITTCTTVFYKQYNCLNI